jgi:hypothetical protein
LRTWSALRHGYVKKRNKPSSFVMLQRVCLQSAVKLWALNLAQNNAREKGVRAMMINKVRTNKKYPFKQMSTGETLKLNDVDVRDAQKAAYYYRSLCKRPIQIVITKQDDGYYCRRVA